MIGTEGPEDNQTFAREVSLNREWNRTLLFAWGAEVSSSVVARLSPFAAVVSGTGAQVIILADNVLRGGNAVRPS